MSDGVKVVGAPAAPARPARRPESRRSPAAYRSDSTGNGAGGDIGTDLQVDVGTDRPGGEVQPAEVQPAEVHPAVAPIPPSATAARRRMTTRRRAGVIALAVAAVLGIAGTLGFGFAWAGLHGQSSGEAQAEQAARGFVVDLTNFNAKTVDADFSAVTAMATGKFATQAAGFFNSTIRQALQQALASSRGQVRSLYVQSYGGGQASVYAVVDQLYVNDKVPAPQTDVLRMVIDMVQATGVWKVADLTVLQGPTAAGSTATTANPAVTASGPTTATTAPTAPAGG